MKGFIVPFVIALLLAPSFASASFADKAAAAKQDAAAMSQQQLDTLNVRTVSDAFTTGRIIGFDRAEFDALKAEVQSLRAENEMLRSTHAGDIGSAALTDSDLPSLEARVAKLERMFTGLQDSLVLLLGMVTDVLNLLR